MKVIKIIVEQHPDGFVAYPLGLKGAVVGEGETADQTIADVRSATEFHTETFGADTIDDDADVLDAFLMETELAI